MGLVNEEQAEFWASMAPTWIAMEARLEMTAGLPGRMAMDRLGLVPGQRVLDLGCGTGATTVELATRVGSGGEVVGVDIADGMLDAARQRATDLGVANAKFLHADVQTHDLATAGYDAAFSRFGVMFYADPVAAFANVGRAMHPGGCLSFACWQDVFANEWMLVPGMAVMSVTGAPPPMPAPGAPGPFAFADAEQVHAILEGAGFNEIDIIRHNDVMSAAEDDISEYAAMSLKVGAAREALKDASDDVKRRAYEAVSEALRGKVTDGELRLTRGVLLVAAKSG